MHPAVPYVAPVRHLSTSTHYHPPEYARVYQKPVLQKFGTFRDLTRIGFTGSSDGASVLGPHALGRKGKKIKIHHGTSVTSS